MKFLLTILKKNSIILAILLILAGTIAFSSLIADYVIPAKTEKDNALRLLQEGGAFAASQLELPNRLLDRHEKKAFQDKSGIANIKDIFSTVKEEGGATEEISADGSAEKDGGDELSPIE